LRDQVGSAGQLASNCSRHFKSYCEDNVEATFGSQGDEQVTKIRCALHGAFAQWIDVTQTAFYLAAPAVCRPTGACAPKLGSWKEKPWPQKTKPAPLPSFQRRGDLTSAERSA